jgi:hypothetical protein
MRGFMKERRQQLRLGIPMPRLFTMVLMLVVMGLIYTRLRDPSTWSWFASDEGDVEVAKREAPLPPKPSALPAKLETLAKAADRDAAQQARSSAAGPSSAGAALSDKPSDPPRDPEAVADAHARPSAGFKESLPPELQPTGPTDLDPGELEDIRPTLDFLKDGSLQITDWDSHAYYTVMSWVDHQSTTLLRKRARTNVPFNEFRYKPEDLRLAIVELKLNIKQIIPLYSKPRDGVSEPLRSPAGKPLYEVRGFTREGSTNLYFGMITDPPEGMPIGTSINEDARLVGYFLKLQGYYAVGQEIKAEESGKKMRVLQAPLIVGRLVWIIPPTANQPKAPVWLLASILGGAALIVVAVVAWSTWRTRPFGIAPERVSTVTSNPEAEDVDNWLDRAQSGGLPLERMTEAAPRFEWSEVVSDGGSGRIPGNSFPQSGESNNGHGGIGSGQNGSAPP